MAQFFLDGNFNPFPLSQPTATLQITTQVQYANAPAQTSKRTVTISGKSYDVIFENIASMFEGNGMEFCASFGHLTTDTEFDFSLSGRAADMTGFGFDVYNEDVHLVGEFITLDGGQVKDHDGMVITRFRAV